jgi:hypothetical protein
MGEGVKDLAHRISARLPLVTPKPQPLSFTFPKSLALLSLTASSSTLKIEAVFSSETFVKYLQIIKRHIAATAVRTLKLKYG